MTFDEHIDLLLDEALKATFPASDPVALTMAPERPPAHLGAPSKHED